MLFTSQRVVFILLAYLEASLEVEASGPWSAILGDWWGERLSRRFTADLRRYEFTTPTRRQTTTTSTATTTTRKPYRMQPDEWAQYFIFKHVIPQDLFAEMDSTTSPGQARGRIDTTGTTRNALFDFLDLTKTPPTTSSRGIHYYEPYWTNGTWLMKMIPDSRDDEAHHGKYWNYRVDWTTVVSVKRSSYPIRSFCFPICTTWYQDWGPVCGVRLDTGRYKWKYFYRNFTDMCELEYVNCSNRAWQFKLIHRGPCPTSYKHPGDTRQWYYFPDAWTPEDNNMYALDDGIQLAMNVNKYASTWFTGSAYPVWKNVEKIGNIYPFFWPWNQVKELLMPWEMLQQGKKK